MCHTRVGCSRRHAFRFKWIFSNSAKIALADQRFKLVNRLVEVLLNMANLRKMHTINKTPKLKCVLYFAFLTVTSLQLFEVPNGQHRLQILATWMSSSQLLRILCVWWIQQHHQLYNQHKHQHLVQHLHPQQFQLWIRHWNQQSILQLQHLRLQKAPHHHHLKVYRNLLQNFLRTHQHFRWQLSVCTLNCIWRKFFLLPAPSLLPISTPTQPPSNVPTPSPTNFLSSSPTRFATCWGFDCKMVHFEIQCSNNNTIRIPNLNSKQSSFWSAHDNSRQANPCNPSKFQI